MERKQAWTTAPGDCPSSTPRQRPSRHLSQLRRILLFAGVIPSYAVAARDDLNSTGRESNSRPLWFGGRGGANPQRVAETAG
jgi:hypothetical protein